MAQGSGIEWTESTWNPVTGCSKISPGCKHCYAERMAERLQAMGQRNYRNGFALTLQPHMLELPLRWKKPQTIFVNSMSDLFHDEVPLSYIRQVFDVMRRASWHCFQVLTKRSQRLVDLSSQLDWTPNIWMGVSVENDKYRFRIDNLRATSAYVKCGTLTILARQVTAIATTSATKAAAAVAVAANAIMRPITIRGMCSRRTSICHAAVSDARCENAIACTK
jgi:protein gp37